MVTSFLVSFNKLTTDKIITKVHEKEIDRDLILNFS